MGCWNGTCGLSGLPIIHGTEMYVFPIIESYRDSFCYSTALYRPSVLPFRAEYNDYGAGEKCSGVGLDLLVEGIRDQLVEFDVGENKYHDIAVKKEGFDVDMFFEACHEKRLKFMNPMRGYHPEKQHNDVFFTMIRKDIADRLWNEWKFDLWKPRGMKEIPVGFEADQYYLKNVTYAQLARTVEEYMEQAFKRFEEKTKTIKKLIAASNDGTGEGYLYIELQRFFRESHNERSHLLAGIMDHMLNSSSSREFARFLDLGEAIVLNYIADKKEEACNLIQECLLGDMINSFMENTRKVWLPPMHQGSQSECHEEYQLLNRLVEDVITDRKRKYDEDYD